MGSSAICDGVGSHNISCDGQVFTCLAVGPKRPWGMKKRRLPDTFLSLPKTPCQQPSDDEPGGDSEGSTDSGFPEVSGSPENSMEFDLASPPSSPDSDFLRDWPFNLDSNTIDWKIYDSDGNSDADDSSSSSVVESWATSEPHPRYSEEQSSSSWQVPMSVDETMARFFMAELDFTPACLKSRPEPRTPPSRPTDSHNLDIGTPPK